MRFPIKSLAGESLTSVEVSSRGVLLDRGYALIARGDKLNGTVFTARRAEALLSFAAAVTSDRAIVVKSPQGITYTVGDSAFMDELAAVADTPLELIKADEAPFFDAHDIHVISAASLRQLESEWQAPVDPLRFRANIVIDGPELEPFAEERWAGFKFTVGSVTLEGIELCPRCAMPTIDPHTFRRSPDLLKTLTEHHDTNFGLYCRVVAPGVISVGDGWTMCR